ncbi:PREDICTED: putative HVA22-like protein g [Lupinus angustifolius]|uniref:putative HVA22-like protein g n=1 Tax=Lupinus angustifolius TaxID=3871 RepID=UPI00092FA60B|nr:PREDICTED: putative HVA22-like protein g [Lupinus angustifolius]
MLGDLINRCLILVLGYAYPGYECFKVVEKNRVDIEELRFWCKYWIILALFTVLEKFTDILISWLPLYGEMKLGLIIYLWYPKIKGTGVIYENVLRPYVSTHEHDIDRKIHELKVRARDLTVYYWHYCAQHGQEAFLQVLQYLALQTTKISVNVPTPKNEVQGQSESAPQKPSTQSSIDEKQSSSISKGLKRPPSPTPSRVIQRNISETPKAKAMEVDHNYHTEYSEKKETILEPEPGTIYEGNDVHRVNVKDGVSQARARFSKKLDLQNFRVSPIPPQKEL